MILSCDKACKKVVVPCGDLAFDAQAVFAGRGSQQVARHMLDGGKVSGRISFADAAFIVAEDHVHDPVQPVLNAPMASDGLRQRRSVRFERCDIETRFAFDFSAGLAQAFDHDNASKSRPAVTALQPCDIARRGGKPGLDTSVTFL